MLPSVSYVLLSSSFVLAMLSQLLCFNESKYSNLVFANWFIRQRFGKSLLWICQFLKGSFFLLTIQDFLKKDRMTKNGQQLSGTSLEPWGCILNLFPLIHRLFRQVAGNLRCHYDLRGCKYDLQKCECICTHTNHDPEHSKTDSDEKIG